jgi:exopolysaccharide biosynthesis polyprenyl glycosylphosphotransferase
MKNKKRTFSFILIDFIVSILSWIFFYIARKSIIENIEFKTNIQFIKGIFLIPFFWIFIYTIQGTYLDTKRLYRSKVFTQSFVGSLFGTCILFFLILIDDTIHSYQNYYTSIGLLFIIQFLSITLVRLLFVSIQVKRIQQKIDHFNTIVIGKYKQIIDFEKELNSTKKSIGNRIVGILLTDDEKINTKVYYNKDQIINLNDLKKFTRNQHIEEVIIIDNEINTKDLQLLIAILSGLGVSVKIKASDFDIALGTIQQNNIFGLLIKEIKFDTMPLWQKSIKRIIDLVISFVSLICLTPIFILIAIIIKRTSQGPIFFKQERIGKHGQPFKIIKFRTMYVDSEKHGPQLSSANDNRITIFGKFLRKTRIDEFPQFFNVIKGEMSLVGPRPERQFYIDKIAEKEPSFLQLTLIKPGITSWGQVKYGYAENVEQMIQRMRFDLLYLKNRSLALDFKIMFYTLITILKAKGK